MQRAMRQTFQRFSGGSSSYLYSCRGAPYPTILKPNPSISLSLLPPPLSSSSSSSDLFTRVTHGFANFPKNFFYCNTEEFKRMLIEFKNDKTKFPHAMAARIARLDKHEQEDDKLIEELGVILYRDMSGKSERRVYKSPDHGLTMCEPLGMFPPNPYGISGPMFYIFGEAGAIVEYYKNGNKNRKED